MDPGDIKFADLDGDGFINGGLDGVYRLDGKLYVPKSSLPKGYSGSMFGNFIVVDGEAYDAIVNNKKFRTCRYRYSRQPRRP